MIVGNQIDNTRDLTNIGVQKWFHWLKTFYGIFIIVGTPAILSPLLLIQENAKACRCAYGMIIVAVFWIFEVADLAVVSLIPLFLFPLLGVVSAKEISKPYFQDSNVHLMGSLILAVAIEHWEIHRRIVLKCMLLIGLQPRRLLLGFIVITSILSMWINNTSATAMMMPIAEALISYMEVPTDKKQQRKRHGTNIPVKAIEMIVIQNDCPDMNDDNITTRDIGAELPAPDITISTTPVLIVHELESSHGDTKNFSKALLIAIAYSASIGGISTLTGTGTNMVFVGQVSLQFPDSQKIDFLKWMVFAVPLSALLLIILWLYLQFMFLSVSCRQGPHSNTKANQEDMRKLLQGYYQQLRPMKSSEVTVICLFFILVLLWVFKDPQVIPGWGSLFLKDYVSDGTAAMLVSVLLFMIPTGIKKGKLETSLTWKLCVKKLPWGVILLLGSGFALAEAVKESGLSEILATKLQVLSVLQPSLICFLISLSITFLTEITSNITTASIFLPILANLSRAIKINPYYLMIPATVSASFAFMLPVATPSNALIFSSGRLRIIDLVKTGFWMNILAIAALSLSINTWGQALFSLKYFPDWALSKNVTFV